MIKRYLKLALGLSGLAGLNATAQIPGKADEKIALPSFTVSTNLDRSYTANDSLSVSRISVSLLETPQSVVVLNRELVDDIAAGRTFDALKYVAGVTAGNVNYAQDRATLRGLVATDNYVDGVLMLFGETNADPVLIERIEVIKGPAPILFANGPAAGLINKVSKSPLAEARISAKVTVGSFDANRAEFDLTGPLTADKKLLYRLVAVRQDSDGFYDRTYTKRWVFAPMLTYRFSATSEVTLKYDTTETAFGSYNGLPLDRLTRQIIAVDPKTNYADPTNFRTDRLSRLALAGTTQITNWLGARLALTGVWVGVDREESRVGGRAATGVTGQAAEFFGTLPVTGDRTTLLRNSQYFKRESVGLTLQNDYVARYRTGPLEHTTLTGFEWRHGDWNRLGTALVYDSINPFGALPATIPARGAVNQRFDEVSADRKFYALQEVGLLERRVLLSGGVTRNFNRFRALNTLAATNTPTYRRAQATTWQGGIVGKVSSDVSLFGGYNESFQPNNSLDTAGRQLPNLEGKQTEIGVKAKLWQDRVRVTAAWFDIEASTSRAAPPGRPIGAVDFATQTSRGVDADVAVSLNRSWDVIASAARFDLKDSTTVTFPNVSETTASAWVRRAWRDGAAKGLVMGVGANYQSSRDGTAGPNRDGTGSVFNSPANNFANVTFGLPSRTVVDALVAYEWQTWRFAVNVDNAFDKDYVDASRFANTLQPGYGRNVKFSVAYRF
jgi:iron complex outermembrane receptor protein